MTTTGAARAVDGDGHVMEDAKRIARMLDEPYREFRAPSDLSDDFVPVEPLTPLDGMDRNLGTRLFRGRAHSPKDWLAALDRGPLEWSAVYPTLGLYAGYVKDPGYQAALCRAYNDWLAETFYPHCGGRILGVALIPTRDADAAAGEIGRAASLGHAAAMFPADGDHLLGHARYDAAYRAAADADMPIAVHASGSSLAPGADMFPKFIQTHSVAHPYGVLRQFTSMMFEGVFERFPSVRFAFLEAGATWLPWWLDRLDEEHEARGSVDAPSLTRKPSEFVRKGGNVFAGCEPNERLLGRTLDLIGDDVVMYASDYPHWDSDYPESLSHIRTRSDLTEAQREGVLHRAASRFYGRE